MLLSQAKQMSHVFRTLTRLYAAYVERPDEPLSSVIRMTKAAESGVISLEILPLVAKTVAEAETSNEV